MEKTELEKRLVEKTRFLLNTSEDVLKMRLKIRDIRRWLLENRDYITYTTPPTEAFEPLSLELIRLEGEVSDLQNTLCILSCVKRENPDKYRKT